MGTKTRAVQGFINSTLAPGVVAIWNEPRFFFLKNPIEATIDFTLNRSPLAKDKVDSKDKVDPIGSFSYNCASLLESTEFREELNVSLAPHKMVNSGSHDMFVKDEATGTPVLKVE